MDIIVDIDGMRGNFLNHSHFIQISIFCWINAPGAEAENEPLAMSHCSETNGVESLSGKTLSGKNIIQIG